MDDDFIGKRYREPTREEVEQATDRLIGRQHQAFKTDAEFAVKVHVKYVLDSVPPSLTTLENNLRGYLRGLGFKVQGISVKAGSNV